mgnify:CR=1 FL=1
MKIKKLLLGLVFFGGSIYFTFDLYQQFTHQIRDLFFFSGMCLGVILGIILGILQILDAFDKSPLKKEKTEIYKVIDGDLEQSFLYPAPPEDDFTNFFRTKNGFCYILKDKIVLIKDEAEINPKRKVIERDIRPALAFIGLMGLFLIGISINSFLHGVILPGLMYGGLGVYMILKLILSANNSATPIIPASRILKIKYRKAIPFLINGHFSIVFRDQYGRAKKQLIILPGIFNNGRKEEVNALDIMKSEGYLK